MTALEYSNEDEETLYFILKSDIHITSEHNIFYEIIKEFSPKNKMNRLYKKWASSICFTHNFDVFWYIQSIFDAFLIEIRELEVKRRK